MLWHWLNSLMTSLFLDLSILLSVFVLSRKTNLHGIAFAPDGSFVSKSRSDFLSKKRFYDPWLTSIVLNPGFLGHLQKLHVSQSLDLWTHLLSWYNLSVILFFKVAVEFFFSVNWLRFSLISGLSLLSFSMFWSEFTCSMSICCVWWHTHLLNANQNDFNPFLY